jgi:hypothetical protein
VGDGLGFGRFVQVVTAYVKHAVQASAKVFKGNLSGQFHQLLFGKLSQQARIQVIRNVGWRPCHLVRELDDKALEIVENREIMAA